MLARCACTAFLAASVSCNQPVPLEPPAQPAEIVTAASISPPLAAIASSSDTPAVTPLDPAVAQRYQSALETAAQQARAEDYAAAIDAYTAALVAVPGDPRALAGRGDAHLHAGDLTAAAADLHAAEAHASDIKLASRIHFDLGLLAERRDPPAALRQFALSHLFHPTAAAAARISGRTLCLADITLGPDTTPTTSTPPTTWLEIWTAHFAPSKANLKDPNKPADEPAARHRVCRYESLALDACDGQPPWVLRIPGGAADPANAIYADQYILVDLTSTGTLAVAPLVDIDHDPTCEDLYDLAIVRRSPIVVRTTHTLNALGEVCDDDCRDDCVHTRSRTVTTVHARDTLGLLLTVTTPNRPDTDEPLVDVAVDAATATILGGGCDRKLSLPAPPG
jgi:hypothetical protein